MDGKKVEQDKVDLVDSCWQFTRRSTEAPVQDKILQMSLTFRNNFKTASGHRTRAELLRTSANKTTSTTCRT